MARVKEIWKDINGFKGYKISNLANIKQIGYIDKERVYLLGQMRTIVSVIPDKLLKCTLCRGYAVIRLLDKNGVYKLRRRARLMAEHFICKVKDKKFVNHKNGIRDDDSFSNLEWVTQRENSTHWSNSRKKASKYTGVVYNGKVWIARIHINGENKYLGSYKSDRRAGRAYKDELKKRNLINKYAV